MESGDGSLRGLILGQPIELVPHAVEGAPGSVEIVVRKKASPQEVLFNLFLRKESSGWKLDNIEYD
jgi:hypothetical protein